MVCRGPCDAPPRTPFRDEGHTLPAAGGAASRGQPPVETASAQERWLSQSGDPFLGRLQPIADQCWDRE